jgi:glycosyltransferase involved in cell wall biosynthesis
MDLSTLKSKIKDLRCCVIVPTYNNHKTLKKLLEGVLVYTDAIIVVNDGATDSTQEILAAYPTIEQIHLPKNKGKGNALRIGFEQATKLGYEYAITIDSDGQHFPEDIAVFIEHLAASENKNILLIGARNMEQVGVPKKSSFGNKFSNFWFWVETGIWLTDTQSGFRLYPLQQLEHLKFRTNKFEFEIEVIVKAAWNGTQVKNVPVKVLYDEAERVSHFRPFKDFSRISVLNTFLVLIAFFYIKPRDLYKKYRKKGIRRFVLEDMLGSLDSPKKKALSIALGVFIGLSPFWGFHTVIVIFLAILLNLNKTISFVFSNVSLPPFIPFVLYASSKMGQFVLGIEYSYTMEEMTTNFEVLKHLKTYLVGSFSLATVSAIVLGCLGYIVFTIISRKQISLQHE